jgi:hypothetical protein
MSVKTFGNFREMGETTDYLIVSFSPLSLSMHNRWSNNSLSADFLANYWGTFFPAHDRHSQQRQAEVKDTVNYIVNELLENAVKFSYAECQAPIQIELYLFRNDLRFYVTNSVRASEVTPFQAYIHTLLTEDTDALYLEQLERNADQDHPTESRLGFLTILNDYEAELAWKFEANPDEPEVMMVTTMVQLPIVRPQES